MSETLTPELLKRDGLTVAKAIEALATMDPNALLTVEGEYGAYVVTSLLPGIAYETGKPKPYDTGLSCDLTGEDTPNKFRRQRPCVVVD